MRRFVLVVFLSATSASADVLVLNSRDVSYTYAGHGLTVEGCSAAITVEDEAIADHFMGVVFTSSFDAVPWQWHLDFGTSVYDGSGLCVMDERPGRVSLTCE